MASNGYQRHWNGTNRSLSVTTRLFRCSHQRDTAILPPSSVEQCGSLVALAETTSSMISSMDWIWVGCTTDQPLAISTKQWLIFEMVCGFGRYHGVVITTSLWPRSIRPRCCDNRWQSVSSRWHSRTMHHIDHGYRVFRFRYLSSQAMNCMIDGCKTTVNKRVV
jgi:hypothetical protein